LLANADTSRAVARALCCAAQEPPAHALWSGRLDASSFGLSVAHVARVVAALRTLQRACAADGDGGAWPTARDTLASLLGNVVGAPAAPKFRALRTRNAALRARLLRHEGAAALLREVGFVPFVPSAGVPPAEQEEVLCLPMEASLAAARAALARVTAAQSLTDDVPKGGGGGGASGGGAGESAEEAAARRCVCVVRAWRVCAPLCAALKHACCPALVFAPRLLFFWWVAATRRKCTTARRARRSSWTAASAPGRDGARPAGSSSSGGLHNAAQNPLSSPLTQRALCSCRFRRRWDAPAGQYRYACATCAAPASLCERCHDRYASGAPGVHASGHSFTPNPPITSRLAASGASGGGAASESNPWGNFGASVSARSRQRLKERSGM
jgi:hypothetical protein